MLKTNLGRAVSSVNARKLAIVTTRSIAPVSQPVAAVPAHSKPRKPIDKEALRRLTDGMRPSGELEGDFIRRMRDEDRY